MSASPIARQAAMTIPSRKVLIHDAADLPDLYSSTPGGTLYSTTPGGTRIVYERAFLMNLKNSPLARTPPTNLNSLPHNILRNSPTNRQQHQQQVPQAKKPATANSQPKFDEHQEQFDMDL